MVNILWKGLKFTLKKNPPCWIHPLFYILWRMAALCSIDFPSPTSAFSANIWISLSSQEGAALTVLRGAWESLMPHHCLEIAVPFLNHDCLGQGKVRLCKTMGCLPIVLVCGSCKGKEGPSLNDRLHDCMEKVLGPIPVHFS